MRRKVILTAVAFAAVTTPALAAAAIRHSTYSLKGTTTLATIQQTGSPPFSGTQVGAGTLRLSATGPHARTLGLGHGASVVTGPYHNGAFRLSVTLFQPTGSIAIRLTGNVSISAGHVVVTSRGAITGGAGRFRHASGAVSFNGGGPVGASTDTYTMTGHLVLPA